MSSTQGKNVSFDAKLEDQGSSFSRKRFVEYREKVGSRRTLTMTITNDVGETIDMTSSTTYNTGKWKVWRTDGGLVIDGNISFSNRAQGIIQYPLSVADTLAKNTGVFDGEVEIFDDGGIMVEQTETFTFIIQNSY